MNQDLDDRLLPNGEYREAFNVSINKSIGENVGTLQTVLGNELVKDFFNTINKPDLQVIGFYSDNVTDFIYLFLTNNIIEPYVPAGAVGVNTTYPDSQDTLSTGGPITLDNGGTGYNAAIATGQTTAITGSGSGMLVNFDETGGVITNVRIIRFGNGYALNDTITILGGNADAVISVDSILPSWSAIVSFNTKSLTTKVIAQGEWLNFSTLYPVIGVSLLEELLFFTDNRNQPRKVNINNSEGYYTKEDQISVAKYYPYDAIQLYQPSQLSTAIIATDTTSAPVNDSTTIPLTTGAATIDISQGLIGTGVGQNVFVTDNSNLPTSVEVNIPQTLLAGVTINFVAPETTMQDAINEDMGPSATATVAGAVTGLTTFDVTQASFLGNTLVVGQDIFLQNSLNGTYTSLGVKVSNFTLNGPNYEIVADGNVTLSLGDVVKFAIPNPYYNVDFAGKANVDFLRDKFVRFSYRYKFDDGEYSLIAPFTQPCFIPQQDGYFLTQQIGEDTVTDEDRAFQSTEVDFMENKVNKILLNIPLPYKAQNIITDLKVTELDILYKQSDQTSIKVVETIPIIDNVDLAGSDKYYQYEYGSKPPFKTLPQNEVTRVFDKVPVKALAQEIISNRVVYGNFQNKHTPPEFLNYSLAASAKNPFFTSEYESVTKSSSVEYPNATLKQNRTYEVGIVLADRFGRQSTPVFSRTNLAGSPSFLDSTVYSPYRNQFDIPITSSFDGNSIKIQFNATISGSYQGSPGLYNGDPTSQDYNPLGWYSYKAVVKQTEQDYYNAYIPTAMAAYPLDNTKELGVTSHVILYNDNINKIPRDLKEVGPTDKEYRSSVRLFGRVTNFLSVSTPANLDTNQQFYSESIADISSTIATIKDLFDYENFIDITSPEYVFYNFEYDNNDSKFPDSSSFVARISTQKQFGAKVPTAGKYVNGPFLNVYEVEPTVSLLDIYYETTTSGIINDLNEAINAGGGANSFDRIEDWNWFLTEGNNGTTDQDPVPSFRPVKFDGTSFGPDPADTTGEILSILDGSGSAFNPENPGVLYYDAVNPANGIFDIQNNNNGTFNIVLNSPNGNVGLVYNEINELVNPAVDPNQYTFEMKFDHPAAEETVLLKSGPLTNVLPEHKNCPLSGVINVPPNLSIGQVMNPFDLYVGVNGSSTTTLNQLGLSFEISQVLDINTGDDVTDQNLFVLDNTLANTGQVQGKLIYAQQVNIPSAYQVTVKAYDFEGVEPAAAGTCVTNYIFQQGVSGITFGPNGGDVTSNSGDINATTLNGQVTVIGAAQNISVQVELNTISATTINAGSTTNLRIYNDPFGQTTFDDLPTFTPPTVNLPPSPVTQTPTYPPGSPINRSAGTYYFELTIDANSVPPPQEFTAKATIVSVP